MSSEQPDGDGLPSQLSAIAVRRRELADRLDVISALKKLVRDPIYQRRLAAEAVGIVDELLRTSAP